MYMNVTSPIIIGIENRISFSNNDCNKNSASNKYTDVTMILILSVIIVLTCQ